MKGNASSLSQSPRVSSSPRGLPATAQPNCYSSRNHFNVATTNVNLNSFLSLNVTIKSENSLLNSVY